MHKRELPRKCPDFSNSVDGDDRKEHVLFMSLLPSHEVYTMRIGRSSTHSSKLNAESFPKMALCSMDIISRIIVGPLVLFLRGFFFFWLVLFK